MQLSVLIIGFGAVFALAYWFCEVYTPRRMKRKQFEAAARFMAEGVSRLPMRILRAPAPGRASRVPPRPLPPAPAPAHSETTSDPWPFMSSAFPHPETLAALRAIERRCAAVDGEDAANE
jgi:hypothetical protein